MDKRVHLPMLVPVWNQFQAFIIIYCLKITLIDRLIVCMFFWEANPGIYLCILPLDPRFLFSMYPSKMYEHL